MVKSKKDAVCPICDKAVVEAHSPFCSDRCKQVDLNRWLSGSYAIPSDDQEQDFQDYRDEAQ
ncbi:DNA gyrase inhibitor YacG [Rhodobacteraceae bacterium RKSG542]|uniref:DNA gyrase inhibitor YacG n=1 Tax=Pseudovibrio flavus TaxID=2529854 RepID=UPI0012BCB58F|nr:DNA gyrase inhibitor YacG [Pseudovibrio flavus]MTI18854.1 DNA gyrase inhibitor YacG [Pseudovibrio flavus]